MKPYNERLPMIDEAIESTGGVIERIKDYRKTDTHINYTSKLGFFSVDVQWAFCGDTVCTHGEFEQRAKELGWINGYKWGVEYETNGKKPDLPDDVLVELLYRDGDKGETSCLSILRWDHVGKDGDILSFRIVDSRYKPKGEPVGEIPASVLERAYRLRTKAEENQRIEDSQKEQEMNNDWYEKGELLVAGSKHEVFNGKDWIPAKFIGIDHDNRGLVFKTREGYLCYEKIRPLRTETDKLVEQMKKDLAGHCGVSYERATAIFNELAKQGYRKTKPMSEQEFMKQCVDICGHGDARLYRAGCRFIDQGE